MNVGIIEANYGNLPSLSRVLKQIDCNSVLIKGPKDLELVNRVIIPGVGAFPKAMSFFNQSGLTQAIRKYAIKKSNRILGICLGAQLLFESSDEDEQTEGLNLIKGRVIRLNPPHFPFRVPHTGWSETIFTQSFAGFQSGETVPFYYNHSYFFDYVGSSHVTKLQDAPSVITGVLQENILALQFHPEKSLDQGRTLLEYFVSGDNE